MNSKIFHHPSHKIIVIGDSAVGKSSIINRYCCQQFSPSLTATIGLDFKQKQTQINKQPISLQIWDTAGQQKYQNMTKSYFKKVSGIILVFSIEDKKSFKNIEKWIKLLENEVGDNTPKLLIGSKFDLCQSRVVSSDQAKLYGQRYNMRYLEVSSKLKYNINQTFELMATLILNSQTQHLQLTKGTQLQLSSWKYHIKTCQC